MAKDLFEDENEEKFSKEEIKMFADDAETLATQDDEDLGISLSDEKTEGPSEDEEAEMDISGEIDMSLEELEPEAFSYDENTEAASDDAEAWISQDDEDLELSLSDEKTEGPSEDEEISYEEISGGDAEEDKGVGADSPGEMKEYFEDDEVEIPPWDEGVEIPVHGAIVAPKRKKLFVIGGILVFTALVVIGLYTFLTHKQMVSIDKEVKLEDEKPSLFTKKMPIKEAEPEHLGMKVNTAPNIKGTPATSVAEGTPYSFIPEGSDPDIIDKLIFFVANQPAWTSFDTNTGALTGTPRSSDVGDHENIVIMVSDGTATALLPAFTITVTGVAPDMAIEVPQKKVVMDTKSDKEAVSFQKPEVKKEDLTKEVRKDETEKKEVGQYMLPDLTDLVKQSQIQDAALKYYNEVKQYPKAFTLKLEVDCVDNSVMIAFRQGDFDRRMFILPKEISGKGCFVVCWGLYTTQNEAVKALTSIPTFFSNQATKPQIVIIKQYL